MSDIKEILLQESESKRSVNSDILLGVDLTTNEKKLPIDSFSSNIDQYKQYIKEKDASNKYRFVFTINSVCSNVLYNHISEIYKKNDDGSYVYYGAEGKTESAKNNPYIRYKYGKSASVLLNREELVRDTGYSHDKCGGFTYDCGIDIFNNHLFRAKEFVIVADKGNESTCKWFNTICDSAREYNGKELINPTYTGNNGSSHLYYKDTARTYIESVRDNLIERDGWFGFTNPSGIDIPNIKQDYLKTNVNKVINSKKGCEFIDLCPNRKLFSFIPIRNEKLKREEYNWDYCITYPYENYTGNTMVSLIDDNGNSILNGMLGYFCESDGDLISNYEELLDIEGKNEFSDILIRTKFKNNIKTGDYVKIHLVLSSIILPNIKPTTTYYTIKTNVKVRNVGINGYNSMYYLTVNKGDLISGIKTLFDNSGIVKRNLRCYIQRIANGRPCKYYFRKFKRLPNFKNSGEFNIGNLTNEMINKCCLNDFNSSLNKLGFGTNIYGDRMAQIVYGDDIDTSNIHDNLGRPLHELYLTIIKTNRGNKEWYNKVINNRKVGIKFNTIECSHYFSDVTSGIDIPWPYTEDNAPDDNYNIHKLHNIDYQGNSGVLPLFPNSVLPLEENITSGGSQTFSSDNDKGIFLGDIVELDELNVREYVLENVQHRFNTMQREMISDEFKDIKDDEIITDDYDGKFFVKTNNFIDGYYENLAAEGYYYQAHYNIPIREFSEVVNEGQHTIVKLTKASSESMHWFKPLYEVTATTDKNYYFQVGDEIYIYSQGLYGRKEKHVGIITEVSGENFTNIKFTADLRISDENKSEYNFFKPNSEKPLTAYDFNDGSGIYRWRDIESFEFIGTNSELYDSVFTNGAHYIEKNINFFLRRQDPYGVYGLNPVNNDNFEYEYQLLEQAGSEKDVTPAEHFIEGDIQLC